MRLFAFLFVPAPLILTLVFFFSFCRANALWGLYGVNSLNFIQIGFNFISSPFRKCMADFRHTSKVKKMIRERELAQKKLDHHHDSHAQGKAQRFQASRASTDVGALAEK